MNQPQTKNMNKFAFFGTPNVALDTLKVLFANGFIPTVVITSPDAPAGRGMNICETPVAIWAKEHDIPVLKPEKLDTNFIEELKSYDVDLSIVVAYGKILTEELISLPTHGTINIHYSLLPKYRGATPVEQAILDGEKITGVTIQQMEVKLDTGPIIASVEVPIEPNERREDLRAKLVDRGSELLIKTLPDIFSNNIHPKPQQDADASYSRKIKKEDGEIKLDDNAEINFNKYRAYENWPGIFFFQNSKRIKITKAKYENGKFIIENVIPEGKKEIPYTLFLKQ